MGSKLARGISGAADAGAQLSMDQYRANIMAKRDQKLQEYDQVKLQRQQEYGTSERMAGQEYSSAEADKGHDRALELQEKRNQGLLARSMGKKTDKLPAAQKFFSDQANKTLGQIYYEGENAYYAAQAAARANEIYAGMPEDQKDLTSAWEQALGEFQQRQQLPVIDEQVDSEAKDRKGGMFKDPDYAGMTEQEWREKRKQELMSQHGIKNTQEATPDQEVKLPEQVMSKLKEGVNTRFGNGQVWTIQNGQPKRIQ